MKPRVERKKGEWLQENARKPEEGRPKEVSTDLTLKLKDIGMTRNESSKAQRIAVLDDRQFEEYIETNTSS